MGTIQLRYVSAFLAALALAPAAQAFHFGPPAGSTCVGGYFDYSLTNVCYQSLTAAPDVNTGSFWLGCYYVVGGIPGCLTAPYAYTTWDRVVFVETSSYCHYGGGTCVSRTFYLP